MKYLSLFSGIGGFELGIQQSYEDHNKQTSKIEQNGKRGNRNSDVGKVLLHSRSTAPLCVGYSEIDKYAIQVYEKHFNHKNYGDITKIKPEELPDFDLLVGGFPCQAFSIAGKRRGFKDTRGTLFFEIARIIGEKQPRLLLLENVKGLLSHDKGNTFTTIISTLDELGYDCQWQVLNSKNFGVPQNRERVFIVGHLRGTSRPEVFPIEGSNSENLREITKKVSDAQRIYDTDGVAKSQKALGGGLGARTGLYAVTSKKNLGRRFVKTDIFGALTATYHKGVKGDGRPAVAQPIVYDDYNQNFRKDGVAGTLTTNTGSKSERNGQKVVAKAVLTPDRKEKRQNGRRMKENGEPSFTLTSQDKHGVFDGFKVRRLTPKECERLQGFPDYWTDRGIKNEARDSVQISDNQRYKMCGNAVTVDVIREIVKRLI